MALLIVPDGSFYPTMHSQEGDHPNPYKGKKIFFQF
jgi:hypothetical protein